VTKNISKELQEKIYKLLHWNQRYFKIDMIYLVEGGSWLTLGQIVSSITSFLLAVIFANFLSKEDYGTYKYVLSLVGILNIFTLPGMGTALIQTVARGYDGSLISVVKSKICWGILGSFVSLILAGYYFVHGNTLLGISFIISAIFIPFMDSFSIYSSFLYGKKCFNIASKYGIISQIIATLLLIFSLFLTKNLLFILVIYFLSWTLLRFIFFIITTKKFLSNQEKDPEVISYGKHLSLMGIISTIAYQIDRLLVFHYLGATEVAIYSVAIAPLEQIKGLLKNIGPLALPKFAERSKEEIKKTIFKKILFFFSAISSIVIIYIFSAPFLFKVFFPFYLNSVFYSQIFSFSLLPTAFYLIGTVALQSQKKQKQLYQLNIIGSIIEIILLFVLIREYGLLGAILARIVSRFIGGIFALKLVKTI